MFESLVGGLRRALSGDRPDETEALRQALAEARVDLDVARAEAAAAARSRDRFLDNMHHELRTPLNAILGYSELLTECAEDMPPSAVRGDLQNIQEAGRRLLGMIDDVLELTALEAGQAEVVLEERGVAALVGEVIDRLGPQLSASGNCLTVEIPADLEPARTDSERLRQTLFRLLTNACAFTRNGHIHLRATREGGWLCFEIQDTGVGMTAEELDRAFAPLTQVDEGATRRHGGVGLGLTLARASCELLGGELSGRSAPGEGSSFAIRLPAAA